jgi:integrase
VNLGTKDEITKRQAEKKLEKIVDKMEAEALLVEDQAQEANGVMTLKRYIEEHYMTEFWPNLRPGTRKAYKQIINARVIPELGAVELNNVGRSDVQLLITNSRPKRNRDQVRLARHTVDNIRTVLGSIFREAELSKYLTDTPVYKIRMPVKDPKRKVAIPDAELVQAIVDSLKEPYRTLTWFDATMGRRIGEAFGLKWNAVDFAGKKIWFLEARYMGREKHLTKGHRAQTPVYLTDFEVACLKAFKLTSENQGEDDLVHGKPLTEDHALQQQLQKAAERKGLHLTFHGLRHWAGTMLYRAGVPIKDIQARLGHSRWQTTADWYIEENDQGQQNAAEIASRFLRPVTNAQATTAVNN